MQTDLNKNYFELFGLPVGYRVDPADLNSRYRELQRHAHPDRYVGAGDAERRYALQLTAQLNAAWQTLKDPVQRGRYLLQLHGVDTGEETDTVMNSAFLVEQMELRERLEEAREKQDTDDLHTIGERLRARLSESEHELATHFDRDVASLGRARELVREMQFLQKGLRDIDSLEEEWA